MLYWRNIAGNTIAETDGNGSTSNSSYHEYVFFDGRRLARSDVSSGSVYYYFMDHLGGTRIMNNAGGSVCFKIEYYPYGQEQPNSTTTCNTSYKFTGYERDGETVLDYAFARYYNARLGRFMSGDPLPGDTGDPQSLNHYAYVANNPIKFTDPTGLCKNSDGAYECTVTADPDEEPLGSASGSGFGSGSFGTGCTMFSFDGDGIAIVSCDGGVMSSGNGDCSTCGYNIGGGYPAPVLPPPGAPAFRRRQRRGARPFEL
jgi:RHS repeat-associated protein